MCQEKLLWFQTRRQKIDVFHKQQILIDLYMNPLAYNQIDFERVSRSQ